MVVLFMLCCLLIIVPCSVEAAPPEYMYHICRNSSTNTPNTIFQANRNVLLSTLASNATQNKGYYNYTAGRNSKDMAYGNSLCQGDLVPKDCQQCVTAATDDIKNKCPNGIFGIIWYAECMVRYDNKAFFTLFGVEEEGLAVRLWNTQNVTDEARFQQVLGNTMNNLVTKASEGKPLNDQTIKSFALGTAKLSSLQNLYALAQCVPDLPEAACSRCLRVAVNLLQYHSNSQGGRALVSTCTVRYELYPFYRNIATAPPPSQVTSPPPAPPHSEGPSSITGHKGSIYVYFYKLMLSSYTK
ncbi:hypothetical protein DCAR_0831478 [Daucus carota subsp. sativus]|uniref:Gnk2-homologous domain-containing protein n=1 Tax=Daucus carota subsp. sativus TaxID=79200 RepID=A0AAF0XRL4_DAUCS|nr:hypothetical protein DCAR_0831478 [Daucus carota subsp. sativus]